MSDASTERAEWYQYLCREANKFNWAWAAAGSGFVTCIVLAWLAGFPGGWNWLLGAVAASVASLSFLIETHYWHLKIALHLLPDDIKSRA